MIKQTLYFGSSAYLSLRNNQMVIKIPEVECNDVSEVIKRESVVTRPIEDIGVVVLDNRRLTITQGLISALLDNNCAVVTCNEKSMPTGLLLPLQGNSTQNERFRQQLESSVPLRKQLWQQTVVQKIKNQAAVLVKCSGAENKCMFAWAKEVRSDDADNVEGRAAAYYWKNFFPMVDDFVRGQFDDAPNNYLNYGYAILRAVVARALVSSGLLPTLGIHHHNRYNAYCLADDIMEPYRPYVDELVYGLVRKFGLVEDFTRDIKAELLAIPSLDVNINGKRSPLMVAVSQTTASLYRCFAGSDKRIVYPEI